MEDVTKKETAPDLRAHFEAHAAELADCATLEVGKDPRDHKVTRLILVPNNPKSLTVYLRYRGGALDVGFDDPYANEDDMPDVESVDFYIDAAVEGRVLARHGPSRGDIDIDVGEGYRGWCKTVVGLRGLVPRPGWRRRATVIDYAPYRG